MALVTIETSNIISLHISILFQNICRKADSPHWWYYLPTSPLGQDMTQGKFLSGD